MKFVFIAKHGSVCALGLSRSGFHAWLNRSPSAGSRRDEALSDPRQSFTGGKANELDVEEG